MLDSYEIRDIAHSLYIVSLIIEWYCSPQWLKKINVFLNRFGSWEVQMQGLHVVAALLHRITMDGITRWEKTARNEKEGPDDVSSGGRGGGERNGRGWMRMNMRLSLKMFIWEGKTIYSKAILLMMNMPAAGHWPIQKSGTLLSYSVLEGSTSYSVALAGFSMNFWWPFRP